VSEGTTKRSDVAESLRAALSSTAIRPPSISGNVRDMAEKITLTQEAIAALRRGNKIEAIRLMREKSGVGLAEAKAVVEAFEKVSNLAGNAKVVMKQVVAVKRGAPVHVEAPRDGLSPGEVPRGAGPLKAAVAVVVAIVVAILWAKLG
jgi:ribosomal protein L7/L12